MVGIEVNLKHEIELFEVWYSSWNEQPLRGKDIAGTWQYPPGPVQRMWEAWLARARLPATATAYQGALQMAMKRN